MVVTRTSWLRSHRTCSKPGASAASAAKLVLSEETVGCSDDTAIRATASAGPTAWRIRTMSRGRLRRRKPANGSCGSQATTLAPAARIARARLPTWAPMSKAS